jgi:hypothetical protein
MLTVIESPLFTQLWPDYWTEEARGEFAAYLANNPDAGDVIPGSGGFRQTRRGQGDLYRAVGSGALVLLVIYAKNVRDTISPNVLKKIAEEMGHATK